MTRWVNAMSDVALGILVVSAAVAEHGWWRVVSDDDESAALLELCDKRDAFLAAVRSNDAESIFAAMKNSNIIPGRYV